MARLAKKPAPDRGEATQPEMDAETEIMLKSAAVMPKNDGVTHVEQNSRAIFEKYHPSFKVKALRLMEAQTEHARLKIELDELRLERKKIPDITPPNTKENKDV